MKPSFTVGTEKFLLPLDPSLSFPSCSVWAPALPFLPQRGASRAAEVSSRWAGELGHGGPSGRGLREAQGSLQSLHWRGSETGQVRSSTGGSGTVWATPVGPSRPCVKLTLYSSLLFSTRYFRFYFYGRKSMENIGFGINTPEFKSILHFLAI